MTTKAQQAKINEARDTLRAMLKPNDVIYTRLNYCARSGMSRVIDLFVMRDNEPRRITWLACQALGEKYNEQHEGLKMTGCGMDMGFSAVYNLGYALWPNGTTEPHGTRNGEPDSNGGYALKQRWL
ncbi:hypothetical protein UFOVP147_24 [uncultured Caudovirales phage]|uniref:Uncharacterized protein n=1 Tax=uncultured Caudovirales phage TaxID=2100421 RepID=A0A6J7W1L6_9CAUD|nr:hypothetical protein UFOVP147_24 [uncultured Caudovirales phage]